MKKLQNKTHEPIYNADGGLLLSQSNRYQSEKGEISLLSPCLGTMGLYEIYCISGDLFEDIERYDSLSEAEDVIKEYLD